MEITYKILATDGKEYGPVNLQQLQDWVREGRVSAETQLLRSDLVEWMAASRFAELSLQPGPNPPGLTASPAAAGAPVSVDLLELDKRVRSARQLVLLGGRAVAREFSGGFHRRRRRVCHRTERDSVPRRDAGGGWREREGDRSGAGRARVGAFATFGVFACKRHSWAFIVGMVLYAFRYVADGSCPALARAGVPRVGAGQLVPRACAPRCRRMR
jgi:hypothetical protein